MKESDKFSYPDKSVTEEVSDYYYDEVLKRVPSGKTVLDVGSGIGTNVYKMSRFSKKVIGIDLSDERIGRAKRSFGHLKNAEFQVMDATKPEFEDGSFDVIFSSGTMHHLPLHETLSQFKRLLRKGGIIYIFDVYRDYYLPSSRVYVWLSVLRAKGIVKTTSIFFKMLRQFSKKSAISHRMEDRARMRKWRRYTIGDIKEAYKSELPGCEVGVIRPRYYVWWQKK